MIENFAKKLTNMQIKFPLIFILVFVVITAALIPGIFLLVNNVEPSLEKVLPNNVIEVQTMNNMRAQFGADMVYLVLEPTGPSYDIRSPEILKYMLILEDKIKTNEHIISATSIADLSRQLNNGILPQTLADSKNIISSIQWNERYINENYDLGIIEIQTDTGASAKTINKVINEIKDDISFTDELNPGVSIKLTGFNAIDKATFEVIMLDFKNITLVSMLAVMIVVIITFRSFVKSMLPMLIVLLSLLWTLGIAGYLGLTVTVVSMVASAMIMGLGIDFGIHIVHQYYHLRPKLKPKEAIKETMIELLRAMIGASATTIAGFLALLFGVLPAMQTLGIMLALGIFSTLIGATGLLPAVLYLYDKNKTHR